MKTFDELIRHRQRVRYLEMASWQDLARMLAHEIRPLTPIGLVTSLSKAYTSRSEPEFRALLDQAQTMIVEELGYLKNTVSKFGEFARLPAARLVESDVRRDGQDGEDPGGSLRVRRSGNHRGSGTVRGPCTDRCGIVQADIYQHRT